MRFFLSFIVIGSLLFVGVGCGSPAVALRPVTLEYWRYDTPDNALVPLIEKYTAEHPNVTISVKNFPFNEYQQELIEAFAEDRGPDLFAIPNTSLHQWKNQALPMPGETAVATPVSAEANNGKAGVLLKRTPAPTLREISTMFVDVVAKDILITIPAQDDAPEATAVLGMPFSADTLALFSNTDVLRNANVSEPPKTWQELAALAQRFTVDRGEEITFSGAALGTARNIPHSTEILTALIQQNGATLTESNGFARFSEPERGSQNIPAIDALLFYRDFANPGAATYSWNGGMPNALDAFVTGKTAFYFGFPADARAIRERSPRLRFTVSTLPQVSLGKMSTIAQYPIEVVSKKTTTPNEAWDFLLFASKAENVGSYLALTGQPPALRSLLDAAIANPDVAPFASQVLIAKSWYRGNDYGVVERAFRTMIEAQFEDAGDIRSLLTQVVSQINSTITR